MDKIIIKTSFDFDRYSKKALMLKSNRARKVVNKYFRAKKVSVEFVDCVGEENYIEVIYSRMGKKDKKFLETSYLNSTHKNVAFIHSDKKFFEIVDMYAPAVVW